jgi:hypothetical protein
MRHAINSAANFYIGGVLTRDRRIGSWLQNFGIRDDSQFQPKCTYFIFLLQKLVIKNRKKY